MNTSLSPGVGHFWTLVSPMLLHRVLDHDPSTTPCPPLCSLPTKSATVIAQLFDEECCCRASLVSARLDLPHIRATFSETANIRINQVLRRGGGPVWPQSLWLRIKFSSLMSHESISRLELLPWQPSTSFRQIGRVGTWQVRQPSHPQLRPPDI